MLLIAGVAFADPVAAVLEPPQVVEPSTMSLMEWAEYRETVVQLKSVLGEGLTQEVPEALGYGFNYVRPGTGNLSWALAERQGVLSVCVDINRNGRIEPEEVRVLALSGQGRHEGTEELDGLTYTFVATKKEGQIRVGFGNSHTRKGHVEIADTAYAIELRATGGNWAEGLLGIDHNRDGRIAFALIDPEVHDLSASSELVVGKSLFVVEASTLGLGFVRRGDASGPGFAELRVGLPMPLIGDDLGAKGGLVVFVSPGCGFCAELEPLLAQVGVPVLEVFDGSEKQASVWANTHGTDLQRITGVRARALWTAFGVRGTPAAVLVSPAGKIERVDVGLHAIQEGLQSTP